MQMSQKKEEKYINYEDSKKLMYAIQDKIKDSNSLAYYAILLALTSGFRFSEIVGLTRSDFDFEERPITVNKTWGYYAEMKKGFGPTKNEQSNRTIQMDQTTMNIFKELFEQKEVEEENEHNLVFFNNPNTLYKVISNSYVNRVLKRLLKVINVKPIITLHGLRHTHASVMLYKGASIQYVSKRLGHNDIFTTYEHYLRLIIELKDKDEKKTLDTFN